MSWRITPTQPVPVDLQGIGSVSLLLHGNGTNGSTTITDSSPTPKTVTAVGNAQISTAQSKFGGSSIAFDGSGDFLTVPYESGSYIGGDNFTVETWIHINQYKTRNSVICGVFSYQDDAEQTWVMFFNSSGSLLFGFEDLGNVGGTGDITVLNTGANVIPTGQWVHLAITKENNTYRAFIDGVNRAQATSIYTIDLRSTLVPLCIGGLTRGVTESQSVDGYIDDLRITKFCRYTANFTPPTAPFPDI